MKFQHRREVEPEINVTSLIDVVLLLVLFFMVSTSFVQEGRLRVHLPESGTTPEQRPLEAGLSPLGETSGVGEAVLVSSGGHAPYGATNGPPRF